MKSKKHILFFFIILSIFIVILSSCSDSNYTIPESFQPGDQLKMPEEGEMIAVIDTSMGIIKARLFPAQAPLAVENFSKLAKKGYYDNIIFHRISKGEFIQTGDPSGTGSGGKSIWGKPFKNEFNNDLFNYNGALTMANKGPDTNMSQFFIVNSSKKMYEVDKNMLIGKGWPEGAAEGYVKAGGGIYKYDGNYYKEGSGYTVFGQVFEGMDIVSKIASAETDENYKPKEDITIKSIKIMKYKAE